VDHPPYSPILAPCDFLLFPKLKNALKGQRFADIPDIQCNIMLLQGIPENYFQYCFWHWHQHFTGCTVSQGEYFEGTTTNLEQVSKFCFHRAIPGTK
jgi:hypothetical protein